MRKMAESDLFMVCDEDDLAPCQSVAENTDLVCSTVQSDSCVLSTQPDGISCKETLATADVTNQAARLANVPTLALLPNAIQSHGTAGGTLGQTIFITSPPNPGQPLAGSLGLGTSLGYFLNGQPITFLTTAQGSQLLGPRLVTPGSATQPTSSGNIPANRLQMPVTLTLSNPSTLQSFTSVAPGVHSLTVTPSNILPTTAPGQKLKFLKFKKFNVGAGQIVSSPVQPAKALAFQTNPTARAPSQLQSVGQPQTTRPPAQNTDHHPVTGTTVFKKGPNLSAVCVRCRCQYQKSQFLRGYFCQCNQELINSIWRLKSKKRKKYRSVKTHSETSTSDTRVSLSKSSETSLGHVSTSEIPAEAPCPGSGNTDNQGRLIMLVEDFFYGQRPGRPAHNKTKPETIIMKCQLCDQRLMGNIKLMTHMRHHIDMEHLSGEMDCHTMCQHCYRNFSTPFRLQCHVETVHSQLESSKVCKICELSFDNEPLFLNHMKHVHKPGEMPYMCQVCEFRSSFHQDVISHFAEQHKDTCNLLCIYCLKVFKSCTGYQVHYLKHQKKTITRCDKCRLQFLFAKDRMEHKYKFHRTCVKPKQLQGLTAGTRVIIRAYALNQDLHNNKDHLGATQTNASTTSEAKTFSNTSSSTPEPQNRTVIPTKKKPVESMVELMVKFQRQCNQTEKQFCMECSYEIPHFANHFPTYVHCSLCRYCTCCSRAYANHMISVHVSHKITRKYITLYKSCPRRGRLSCTDCKYKTQFGDLMARHLSEFPTHNASRCTLREGFSRGYKRFVFIPTDLIKGAQRLNNSVVWPLQVKQLNKSSYPPSTKPLPRPRYTITLPTGLAHTQALPIQVQPVAQSPVPDQNCEAKQKASKHLDGGFYKGNNINLEHTAERPQPVSQLKIVLYSLCFGVPQAANHFDTQPEEVQSLLLKQKLQLEEHLGSREALNPQAADRLVEWVLCQREQQLPIDEANLFNKASEFMGSDGGLNISYEWVVDFLLHYDLGLQAFATSRKPLSQKSQELVCSFISFLNQQIASQSFRPSAVGAMDELSIFIDMKQLDRASSDSSSMMSAFKLMGTSAPLIDVVFTALADGTLLSTMMFLRGEPLGPGGTSLPNYLILEAKPEGFTNEERLQLWLDKVWRPHVNPSSGGKGLLIMDTYKGHMADEFLATFNSANTMPGVIPRSSSHHLQPLEACMGPVLREFLQACWSQHVTSAPQELVGVRPVDLARLVSGWLIEILDVLKAESKLLLHSFDQVLKTNTEEPSDLVQSLTKALFASKSQQDQSIVAQQNVSANVASPSVAFLDVVSPDVASPSVVSSPRSLSSPSASILALKKIFEKDSDVESFHGFEDTDMIDH